MKMGSTDSSFPRQGRRDQGKQLLLTVSCREHEQESAAGASPV